MNRRRTYKLTHENVTAISDVLWRVSQAIKRADGLTDDEREPYLAECAKAAEDWHWFIASIVRRPR